MAQKVIGGDYRIIRFASRKIAPQVKPGQFVHLRVTEHNEIILRRPFSVFKAGRKSLSVLYKIVGAGTAIMAQLRAGDKVSLIGPLGKGFPMPASDVEPLFVAGGYGSAALYLLAERIPNKGIIFIGGKTKRDILCVDDFKKIGWKVVVATEDASMGQKGLVTDAVRKWMGISEKVGRGVPAEPPNGTAHPEGSPYLRTNQLELFACGPMGMLKAVSHIAIQAGLKAWLSLDNNLGCGVGACLACVQKVKAAGGQGTDDGWQWKRVCTEGPVFECREIVWE